MANFILDTFAIVFEADAKKLEEGLDNSRKEADKLNEELKKTDGNAQKATSSMGAAFKSFAALAVGFLAIGSAKDLFTETVSELVAIGESVEKIGGSIEDVDALGQSVKILGGDSKSARDSMVSMWESITAASEDSTSKQSKAFSALGIMVEDVNGKSITATQGMLELASAVEDMSKEAAIAAINDVGIKDEKTVELILKGRKEMERMLSVQKEQSGVTKESVENARKYTEAMDKMGVAGRTVTNTIANALLPVITSVIPVLQEVIEWVIKGVNWMQENSQTVIAFFGAIAAAVAITYLPAMVSAAAATLAAMWPIVAAAAVVTGLAAAFALLYDDIQNFLAGNDSLIGQISEKYPIVGQIVMGVVDGISAAWQGVKSVMGDLWDALSPLGEAFAATFGAAGEAASAFMSLITAVVARISNLLGVDLAGSFTLVGDTIGFVMNAAVSVVRGAVSFIVGALGQITETVSGIGGAIKAVAGFIGMKKEGDSVDGAMKSGGSAISSANAAPLNSTTSNAIANTANSVSKETNVQVGQVTVQTQATDAQGIASDVGGALSSQLARMDNEFASGVDR